MAPRKLIIAMLVLLGFSTGLAVLAPDPPQPERQVIEAEPQPGNSPEQPVEPAATGGRAADAPGEREGAETVTREITVRAGQSPRLVTARPGDRLVLEVETDRTAVIEVTGLGLTGTATPYAPAIFDVLLPTGPDRYEVRRQPGRPLLTIAVRD